MTVAQLTLLGGEETIEASTARSRPRSLSDYAHAVLRRAGEQGGVITSSQAGRVVHDVGRALGRRGPCARPNLPGAAGCCWWAPSDGWELLRGLERRGLVEQLSRGLWAVLAPGERPSTRRFKPGVGL